jgi:hypothetical protein
MFSGGAPKTRVNDQELLPSPSSSPFHPSIDLGSDPFIDTASGSNFKLDFDVTSFKPEDLQVSSYDSELDREPIIDDSESMPCSGQPVEWTPGSVWDSYAYQMHDDNSLPWDLIGFQEGNFIIIKSRDDCTGSLFSDKERD